MRTTVADCARLFIALVRARDLRKNLRIGQLLDNAADPLTVFYIENADLVARISRYARLVGIHKALGSQPEER